MGRWPSVFSSRPSFSTSFTSEDQPTNHAIFSSSIIQTESTSVWNMQIRGWGHPDLVLPKMLWHLHLFKGTFENEDMWERWDKKRQKCKREWTMSSFTHPHVALNPKTFFLPLNTIEEMLMNDHADLSQWKQTVTRGCQTKVDHTVYVP